MGMGIFSILLIENMPTVILALVLGTALGLIIQAMVFACNLGVVTSLVVIPQAIVFFPSSLPQKRSIRSQCRL